MIEAETTPAGGRAVIYQKLLSRIETGKMPLEKLTLRQAHELARALEWTPEDFSRETGVREFAPQPTNASSASAAGTRVAFWGPVSLGVRRHLEGDSVIENMPLDFRSLGLSTRDVDRLGTLSVEGEMMLTPKAAEGIVEGRLLIVEWGALPVGDVLVVGWLPEHRVAGLKWNDEKGDALLSSTDPNGQVVRLGSADFDVRGVVRYVVKKPSY